MKKPIDPNLNNFDDDLEGALAREDTPTSNEELSLYGETERAPVVEDNGDMQIEVKKNHYSGEPHHHHHHHHHHSSDGDSHHHSGSSHHHSSKKKKKKLPIAARIAIAILIIILLFIFAGVGTFFFLEHRGEEDIKNVNTQTDYQEVLEYKGHKYIYNEDMATLAFIGVDKRELGLDNNQVGTAGQADTNIVIAVDTKTGKTTAIAIPRDTMVEVDLYSESGLFLRSEKMQLCLSYAYGDGKATSAANVTTSIGRILGNVPINKYFALDLDGIAPLNDAVGGVTVESLYNFENLGIREGDVVHLEGSMAESYVRQRDIDTVNASLNRTARQVQYIKAFAGQLVPAVVNDFSTVSRLYNIASKYSSTDINLETTTYFASLLLRRNIASFDTITLQGEMKESTTVDYGDFVYAEFYPNEEKLMDTIISVFYKQAD